MTKSYRLLALTETAGWDHLTKNASDSALAELGTDNGFSVVTTDRSEPWFTDSGLSTFDAVCCINTTGALFTDDESTALQRYIKNGGGFIGMHACTDAEYLHPWFAEMTGANFNGHPFNSAAARIAVIDKKHPSTRMIVTDTLTRTDEWYFWADNPDIRGNPLVDPAENADIHVLLSLDESSITGSSLAGNHPICWYRSYGNGKIWYCGFGHDPQTFRDTLIRQMLLGGIRYATGMESSAVGQPGAAVPESVPVVNVSTDLYDLRGRLVGKAAVNQCTRHGVYITQRRSTFLLLQR